jgi:hypothetical protein
MLNEITFAMVPCKRQYGAACRADGITRERSPIISHYGRGAVAFGGQSRFYFGEKEAQAVTIESVSETAGTAADLKKARRQKATGRSPQSTTASSTERAIVATLAECNGDLTPYLARLITAAPESFIDADCGKIAARIRKLRSLGKPVHARTLTELLPELGMTTELILGVGALPIGLAELDAEKLWHDYQARQSAKLLNEGMEALTAHPDRAQAIRSRIISELQRLDSETNVDGLSTRTPDEILVMQFDDSDRILGDRLLALGQSLVIAGQGGLGKSRMLLQLIVACRAGLPFVGFETRGQEMSWLVIQGENSNRRLQQDFASLRAWVGEKHWPQVNAGIVIHTLETDADNFLSLDNEQTQARIREIIAKTKPDCIAWDSLYNFGIGNLSADEDMTGTLLAIARLSRSGNPNRAIVTVHHALTGKAGASRAMGFDRASFARNSKVLHQWTRGQINVAPGLSDSNEVLVLTCGKCSNGKEFAPFAVRLNPDTMIYAPDESFDLTAWQNEVTGKREAPLMSVDRVRELCTRAMSKTELAKKIAHDCGCTKSTGFRWVQRADKGGRIKWNKTNETYTAKT